MRRTARTGSGGRAGVAGRRGAARGVLRHRPPVPTGAGPCRGPRRRPAHREGRVSWPASGLGRTARRGGPRGHGHPGVLVRLGEDAYDVGLTGARAPGDRGTGPQRPADAFPTWWDGAGGDTGAAWNLLVLTRDGGRLLTRGP